MLLKKKDRNSKILWNKIQISEYIKSMGNKIFTHYYDSLACSMRDVDASTKWIHERKIFFDSQTGDLTIAHDKEKIRQEGPFLISKEDGRLHLCFSQEEVITVPDGVKSIASGAFTKELCPNLRHLILPESVDGVSHMAIGSDTLEQVSVWNKYIYISDAAFNQVRNEFAIHMIDNVTYIVEIGTEGPQVKQYMQSSEYANYVYAKINDLPF